MYHLGMFGEEKSILSPDFFFINFFFGHKVCVILVPHTLVPQGMCDLSAQTPALEVLSLKHWTTRRSLYLDFMKSPALTCLLIY